MRKETDLDSICFPLSFSLRLTVCRRAAVAVLRRGVMRRGDGVRLLLLLVVLLLLLLLLVTSLMKVQRHGGDGHGRGRRRLGREGRRRAAAVRSSSASPRSSSRSSGIPHDAVAARDLERKTFEKEKKRKGQLQQEGRRRKKKEEEHALCRSLGQFKRRRLYPPRSCSLACIISYPPAHIDRYINVARQARQKKERKGGCAKAREQKARADLRARHIALFRARRRIEKNKQSRPRLTSCATDAFLSLPALMIGDILCSG